MYFLVKEIQLFILMSNAATFLMDWAGASPGRNEQATQAQGPYLFPSKTLALYIRVILYHGHYLFVYDVICFISNFSARS